MQGWDLNPRPSGYEPDELTTATTLLKCPCHLAILRKVAKSVKLLCRQAVKIGILQANAKAKCHKKEVWMGRRDSNPRMTGPKPVALPLGDTPAKM